LCSQAILLYCGCRDGSEKHDSCAAATREILIDLELENGDKYRNSAYGKVFADELGFDLLKTSLIVIEGAYAPSRRQESRAGAHQVSRRAWKI